jgi:Na+-transporting methylmalonyl-CoA/oxaloacetate decarboxylase gamma subunit
LHVPCLSLHIPLVFVFLFLSFLVLWLHLTRRCIKKRIPGAN